MSGYYVRNHPQVQFISRIFDGDGSPCAACGAPVEGKDEATLVPLGPGADPEARRKAGLGQWYNAVAVLTHRACARGEAS